MRDVSQQGLNAPLTPQRYNLIKYNPNKMQEKCQYHPKKLLLSYQNALKR